MKKFIFLLVFLLVIAGCAKGPGKYDSFAQCLTEKGAAMYGTEWCSHCKNQKELFGNSFQYIYYADCDKRKQECVDAGIEGYPTWIINNESYSGEQSLEKLAALTGCEL
jgi:glutaredoxin